MNTDIRLKVSFLNHRKRKKLQRELGADGVLAFVDLMLSCSVSRPDGILIGLDSDDIALDAQWSGDPDQLVQVLCKVGLLDRGEDGFYAIHDWQEHNGYAADADNRGNSARFSNLKRWHPEKAKELERQGVTSLTAEEYKVAIGSMKRLSDERSLSGTDPLPINTDERSLSGTDPPSHLLPISFPSLHLKDFCPEVPPGPSEPDPPIEAVMAFPLNVNGDEFAVTQSDVDQWQETFPGVDVPTELRKCRQWSIDHPDRRKTKRGIRGHISTWLGKEQDKAGMKLGREPTAQQQRPKAFTVAQDLAQQRNDEAKRLCEKYGIGEANEPKGISIGGQGNAGSLELGAPRGPALARIA